MAYASQVDLENVYGIDLVRRLSDHDNDGQADQAPIDDALAAASAVIDSHLSARYSVPLENAPPIVRDLCVDIALYRLAYSRLKQTDEMRLRYDDAIKLLMRVADGKASIGLDTDDDSQSDDALSRWEARTSFLNRA